MAFLAPLSLLLGLIAAPIVLLYMLRLRRREVLVSSTLLWRKLLRDREANAPWQRLRRNLLLILQLLILAALVLALARPFLPVPSVVSGSVVVLLDASASMRATDVDGNRFEAARDIVAAWIGDLGGDDRMTLILAGRTPRVLASASADREALHAALEAAAPEAGSADWEAALALASGAAQGFRDAQVVVVSDGGLPDDLPPLPVEVIYVPTGESGENLALLALATRRLAPGTAAGSADQEARTQLFTSVGNLGSETQSAVLSLELDGVLYDSRRVQVAGGERANLTWELQPGVEAVRAHLSGQSSDYLPLDDEAWAVVEGGTANRVLLTGPGNIFLEQAFSALPGVELFVAAPGQPPDPGFDVYVFDGVELPDPLPAAPLLIVNPPPSTDRELLRVTGVFSDTAVISRAESPLLQFVDWGGVDVRAARQVVAPWARPLLTATGGPLLLAGEQEGRRVVVFPFALTDSDLPLHIAFPVLIANITSWLNPGRAFDAPAGLAPGEPVAITPGAETTAVIVEKPDGDRWLQPVEDGPVVFGETEQPGLYQVLLRDRGGDRPAGRFAVNLFQPGESRILPASSLRLGQSMVEQPAGGENVGQRELWPWLAAVAVLILFVEWWVFFRGTRLPSIDLKR
ncbi:MAG: VWA domain-containing protein, partial [Anaerolineae bacterium]|nr:VWA domain-containing protein [Anaerolineae bacterium]